MAKKVTAPKMSADRLASIKRTKVTAGKPKGTMAQRAKQNAGIKDGTVRLGASGKSYNVYDAKTATWKRGTATSKGSPSAPAKTPVSLTKTSTGSTKRFEGPKKPKKDTRSGLDRFAARGVLSVFDRGSGRVTANKVSDFPRGTALQLTKSKNKDAQNRDVYRWVKQVKPKGK
jgi:hypothetical protein